MTRNIYPPVHDPLIYTSGKRTTAPELAATLRARAANRANPILDAARDIYDPAEAYLWATDLLDAAGWIWDDYHFLNQTTPGLEFAREENQVLGYLIGTADEIEANYPEADPDSWRGVLNGYTAPQVFAYAKHAQLVAARFLSVIDPPTHG